MNDSAEYFSHEFDFQADFAQFLEEARKNSVQVNSDVISEEKKKRKSWKSCLFSWLKNDKKSKSFKQPSNTSTTTPARHGHVSGPVKGAMVGFTIGRAQRAVSGPLTGFFGSTGSLEEHELPYMCLSQQGAHSYGPVYLVT